MLFATNWYKLQTNIDVLADVAPWGTEFEARRRMVQLGGLEEAALKRFGQTYNACKDGDIAYVNAPHFCLGIVKLPNIIVVSAQGLIALDVHMGKHFWKTK